MLPELSSYNCFCWSTILELWTTNLKSIFAQFPVKVKNLLIGLMNIYRLVWTFISWSAHPRLYSVVWGSVDYTGRAGEELVSRDWKLDSVHHLKGSLRETQFPSGSFQWPLVQETTQVPLREADYHRHLCRWRPVTMFDLGSPLICLSCPGLLAGEGFANLPRTIPAVYSSVDLGLSPGKKSSKRGEKPHEKIP